MNTTLNDLIFPCKDCSRPCEDYARARNKPYAKPCPELEKFLWDSIQKKKFDYTKETARPSSGGKLASLVRSALIEANLTYKEMTLTEKLLQEDDLNFLATGKQSKLWFKTEQVYEDAMDNCLFFGDTKRFEEIIGLNQEHPRERGRRR
jgi:hypothetical protein